jgi:diguanylate cyclase (GGDEF)-like protein
LWICWPRIGPFPTGNRLYDLADVDHFKSINDTHGHAIGDEVPREIGRRLLLSIRSYDFVGRYGGEEFLPPLGGRIALDAARYAAKLQAVIACG